MQIPKELLSNHDEVDTDDEIGRMPKGGSGAPFYSLTQSINKSVKRKAEEMEEKEREKEHRKEQKPAVIVSLPTTQTEMKAGWSL